MVHWLVGEWLNGELFIVRSLWSIFGLYTLTDVRGLFCPFVFRWAGVAAPNTGCIITENWSEVK